MNGGPPFRCGPGEDDAPLPIGQDVDEWQAAPPAVGRVKIMYPALLGRVLMNGGPPRSLWAG